MVFVHDATCIEGTTGIPQDTKIFCHQGFGHIILLLLLFYFFSSLDIFSKNAYATKRSLQLQEPDLIMNR